MENKKAQAAAQSKSLIYFLVGIAIMGANLLILGMALN
jgi:hypothetical protein